MDERIKVAQGGSPEDVGDLLQTYRSYLLLVANCELDPDLQAKGGASDLVQETYLKAQQQFGRFRGASEKELLAWLRRILLNNLANFSRQYRRTAKRQIDREVSLQAGQSSSVPAIEPASDTPSPSGHAVAREQAQSLERALARLPKDYLRVILLRNWERQSFREIGHEMSRSADAARMLWFRAVERLEKELKSHHDSR